MPFTLAYDTVPNNSFKPTPLRGHADAASRLSSPKDGAFFWVTPCSEIEGNEMAKMTYDPGVIANYFLQKASSEGRALTPMQLLKLVYIAHGWHLGYGMGPLINEEVQAWKYGPVIHSLYRKLSKFGSQAVSEFVQTSYIPWESSAAVEDPQSRELLDSVWQNYSGYSGIQLSNMTHQPGTPWYQAWVNDGGKSTYFAPISNELIRQHYEERVKQAVAA